MTPDGAGRGPSRRSGFSLPRRGDKSSEGGGRPTLPDTVQPVYIG